MRLRVTVRKLNVMDIETDKTYGQTDGWGRFNISRPGPSDRREIKSI